MIAALPCCPYAGTGSCWSGCPLCEGASVGGVELSCAHAPARVQASMPAIQMMCRLLIASLRDHQRVTRLEKNVLLRVIAFDYFLVIERQLLLLAMVCAQQIDRLDIGKLREARLR